MYGTEREKEARRRRRRSSRSSSGRSRRSKRSRASDESFPSPRVFLGTVVALCSVVYYYTPGFSTPGPSVSGRASNVATYLGESLKRKISIGDPCKKASDCGFGRGCEDLKCVEDFSEPWNFGLRPATDQGYCDSSAAISVIHAHDDRETATRGSLSTLYWSSISHYRDCMARQDYAITEKHLAGCNGGNMTRVMQLLDDREDPGTVTEYQTRNRYSVNASTCTKSESKAKRRMNLGGVRCYKSEEIKRVIKNDGPFVHYIRVYKELYYYPQVYGMHGEEDTEVISRDHFRDPRNYDGFLSVEMVGYGSNSVCNFLVMKFPWGTNYGVHKGYIRVCEDAFNRLLKPVCNKGQDDFGYNWNSKYDEDRKTKKFYKPPWMHYTISEKSEDWTEMDQGLRNTILYEENHRREASHVRKVIPDISKESLKYPERSGDFPGLKTAINIFLHHLKKIYKSDKFEFLRLIHADMAVVAGRRYNIVLKMNRTLASKRVKPEVGYVKAMIWVALPVSSNWEYNSKKFYYYDNLEERSELRGKYYIMSKPELDFKSYADFQGATNPLYRYDFYVWAFLLLCMVPCIINQNLPQY
mmetsp:Transcript_3828/g.4639  ORF Transcript_3828/g.4639 Transcript_3828/m.4639 type:complete len:584 (-) Transcript_3828:548-2299(-)